MIKKKCEKWGDATCQPPNEINDITEFIIFVQSLFRINWLRASWLGLTDCPYWSFVCLTWPGAGQWADQGAPNWRSHFSSARSLSWFDNCSCFSHVFLFYLPSVLQYHAISVQFSGTALRPWAPLPWRTSLSSPMGQSRWSTSLCTVLPSSCCHCQRAYWTHLQWQSILWAIPWLLGHLQWSFWSTALPLVSEFESHWLSKMICFPLYSGWRASASDTAGSCARVPN